MPDTFFRNEKVARFHKILAPNLYIRVFPDGDVLYSIRSELLQNLISGVLTWSLLLVQLLVLLDISFLEGAWKAYL